MGFFSYAYIVEMDGDPEEVTASVSVYRANEAALFSWGRGNRPPGMRGFAGDTLFCADDVQLLAGYPRIYSLEVPKSAAAGEFLLEESFFSRKKDEPVLFHVVLPAHFVPARDRTPFTLTREANVDVKGDRLFLTYPAIGGADLRFWIRAMEPGASLADFELNDLMKAPTTRGVDVEFELNIGIAKVKFKRAAGQREP